MFYENLIQTIIKEANLYNVIKNTWDISKNDFYVFKKRISKFIDNALQDARSGAKGREELRKAIAKATEGEVELKILLDGNWELQKTLVKV